MTFNDNMGIERELAPGERLLWKGRPQTGIKFRSQDRKLLSFGLIWSAGTVFFIYQVFKHPPPRHLATSVDATLIVFALVGFYLLIGRFLVDAYARSRMQYALTDRRALILTNVFSRKVRSVDYRSEPNIVLAERRDGSGTIYFGQQFRGETFQENIVSSSNLSAFDLIDNAPDVYRQILKARGDAGLVDTRGQRVGSLTGADGSSGESFMVERELAAGERLLWKGRPRKGIRFRPYDAFSVPAVLIVCALVFNVVINGHWAQESSRVFVLVLFSAFGIYMTIVRFIIDAYTRSRMEYALTDRRALIISNAFRHKVRRIDYQSEPNIVLAERGDGSGTIYFFGKPKGAPPASSWSVRGFDMVENARAIYELILKAQDDAARNILKVG